MTTRKTKNRPKSTIDKLEVIEMANGKEKCMHKCTAPYQRSIFTNLCVLKNEIIRATKPKFKFNEPIKLSLFIDNKTKTYTVQVITAMMNIMSNKNKYHKIYDSPLVINSNSTVQTISLPPVNNNDKYMFVQLLTKDDAKLNRKWIYVANLKKFDDGSIQIGKFVEPRKEDKRRTQRKKKGVVMQEDFEPVIKEERREKSKRGTKGKVEMILLDEAVGQETTLEDPMKLEITNSFSRDLINSSIQMFEDGDEIGQVEMNIEGNSGAILPVKLEYDKEMNNMLNYEFKFLDEMGRILCVYTCRVRIFAKNDENGKPVYYRRLESALKRKPIPRKKTNKIVRPDPPTNNEEVVEE